MRRLTICLIAVEIFAWGKYGGFGRATRLIGRELARLGHRVFAVVPRRREQAPVEQLDGITVLGFSPWQPWEVSRLLARCDADIYHSCEPSLTSYLAIRCMPHKHHMVTVRDPRTWQDWWGEFALPSLSRIQVARNFLYENSWLVHRAVARMDGVYTSGRQLNPKVQAIYRLKEEPGFLPTPVPLPTSRSKAARPTVCYMARLDRRKRPRLVLELARLFPEVRFILAGRSRDTAWEARLRLDAERLPNVEFAGFVDQFTDPRHSEILGQSWVLINTATREGLPNAFIEAMAHGCALLSGVNPDDFAERFGYHAREEDFAEGLRWLLAEDRWRARGQAAAAHIQEVFEMNRAMNLHLEAYQAVLSQPPGRLRTSVTRPAV